ncbi:CTH1, partial [Symbiodinium sp. CCMP2456]
MTKPAAVEKAPGNPHYRGTELCSFFLKGMCRHGTKCNFAHSINDLKEKPDFSKTRLCTNYFKTKSCPYGMRCSFAHSKDEMRSAARSRAAREKVIIDLPEEPGIKTRETREESTTSLVASQRLGSHDTPVLQEPIYIASGEDLLRRPDVDLAQDLASIPWLRYGSGSSATPPTSSTPPASMTPQ